MRVGEIYLLPQIPTIQKNTELVGVIFAEFDNGFSIIFENGSVGEYTNEDINNYLQHLGFCEEISDYFYRGKEKLMMDFNNGYFQDGFDIER